MFGTWRKERAKVGPPGRSTVALAYDGLAIKKRFRYGDSFDLWVGHYSSSNNDKWVKSR